MKRHQLAAACMAVMAVHGALHAQVATFETLSFADGFDYENGQGLSGSESVLNEPFGPGSGSIVTRSSSFSSGGASFANSYSRAFSGLDGTGDFLYDYWGGWAYSRGTDTVTPGFLNQYSAFAGSGAGGSANYAVGYQSGSTLAISFGAAEDFTGRGLFVTNTTYAALDMAGGSLFSKAFGGPSGNDPDYFLLTIGGFLGVTPVGALDFYLADFRFADNSLDYILDEWAFVDLSSLGAVERLEFTLSSSDNGPFGMNTPAYFALDNVGAIPEPATLGLVVLGSAAFLLGRRRRG